MTTKLLLVGACLVLMTISAANAAVPKATCRGGSADKPETALQGQVTRAERESGASKAAAYTCNTNLVGQYQGEGASWQLTAWKNCAYYDQRNSPDLQHPGVVVVDVSDPKNPKPSAYLSEAAMVDPWESLKVNAQRQLLAGAQLNGPGFAVYDVSADCRHPVLKASVNLSGSFGHTGDFAPDGMTYYITPVRTTPSIIAVDITNVAAPSEILIWTAPAPQNPRFHDLTISKDGNRAYVANSGGPATGFDNGLLILDISDIQKRASNPQIRIVSSVSWQDGGAAQNALPVRIGGKPYLIFTDELSNARSGVGTWAQACSKGLPPFGFARIFDISDDTNPQVVSKLMLEVHEPSNCATILADPADTPNTNLFGYSTHYCNVDDADDAKVLACSYFNAGWRFFDIKDPAKPKEIGYYKPPGRGTQALPGSQYFGTAGPTFDRPVDWASSKPSFPKDRGMSSGDVWVTTQDNGFMVLRLNQGGGGGCSSAGLPSGLLAAFAATALLRRKLRKRAPRS